MRLGEPIHMYYECKPEITFVIAGLTVNHGIIICIYPNKSRAHINAWAQISPGVQHSKVNRHIYKMRKGLI